VSHARRQQINLPNTMNDKPERTNRIDILGAASMRRMECILNMKYFVFPNLPNDIWFGRIENPDGCNLVCSCPSDGPVKAAELANMMNDKGRIRQENTRLREKLKAWEKEYTDAEAEFFAA
jgi:hypothetical protein